MSNIIIQEAILHGDLIQRINTALAPYDGYKLRTGLLNDFSAALALARSSNSALALAAGDQAGARGRVTTARDRLAGLVRNVHSYVESVPEEDASPEDKMDALISLGFDQGLIGQLGEVGRLLGIVDATLANNATLPPLLRVPTATINRLTNWKSVHDANEEIANGGPREVLTAQKDAASDLLYARIARVRLYLCSCSDAGEQDHTLARYGFQPKRDSGDAQPQDKPDAAGVVVWDAVTRHLSLPALPLHATSLVAWRQPLGGTAEPCGMSETESVNAAETSPFVPGATYDLWVTGRNSVGDGVASDKVRWTAPV